MPEPMRRVAAWRLARDAEEATMERLAAMVLAATRAAGRPGFAWLDSGGPTLSAASESIIAGFPTRRVRLHRDEAQRVPDLLETLESPRAMASPPGPRFAGGWIGFLGYEAAAGLEPVALTARGDLAVPLASFAAYETWIRRHHASSTLELWTRSDDDAAPGAPAVAEWKQWVEAAASGAGGPLDAAIAPRPTATRIQGERLAATAERSFTRAGFEQAVRTVQDAVREGEVFQANIAHRLRVQTAADPFAVYIALRRLNPSPFAVYLEEDWGALASNSPERLAAVRPDGAARRIEARPIAGTRPRGAHPEEDTRLRAELATSAKERAEHTMLVDLARNDIGRVSVPGSVRVAAFQTVEAYSHVHHLVSRVAGTLRPDARLVDFARALFPGGTVTGAPKLRSIEVIDRAEPVARGPYTGSAGYVGVDGAVDWNILIRTLVFTPGVASCSVGAGIVADSVPAAEFEETLHKAAAMLVALATVDPARTGERLQAAPGAA